MGTNAQNLSKKVNVGNEAINIDNIFYDKYFKYKDLIVSLFSFLKTIMGSSQQAPTHLVSFY